MAKNILIIRRDNIGDLVCTTPLISNLRKAFSDANIDVLVNSYNAPVVEHNPDINTVYIYKKAKHRGQGESIFKVYFERAKTYLEMRRKGIDIVILAGGSENKRSLKVAKIVGAKQIIGYASPDSDTYSEISSPLDIHETKGLHEVELTNRLSATLGVTYEPPACTLVPSKEQLHNVNRFLQQHHINDQVQPIGIHISARKPSNRWTEENYVELIHRIWDTYRQPILLFWSPGSKDNALHPGDDELAEAILKQCSNTQLLPFPTQNLEQLIAGVSICKPFICSDGGAMHIAAATGCPILCFFGDSDAARWYPWGTHSKLIQKKSLSVADISINTAYSELQALMSEL